MIRNRLLGMPACLQNWTPQNGSTEDEALQGVTLQEDGSAVFSGSSGGGLVAVKLNATDGTEMWRWKVLIL